MVFLCAGHAFVQAVRTRAVVASLQIGLAIICFDLNSWWMPFIIWDSVHPTRKSYVLKRTQEIQVLQTYYQMT